MKLRRLIKQNARRALQSHWCRAASIALISIVFCFIFIVLERLFSAIFGLQAFVDPSATPDLYIDDLPNISPVAMTVMGVIAVLYFTVIMPLMMGITRWFYLLGDGRAESTMTVFEYFFSPAQFWKALCLHLHLIVRRLFWSALFLSSPIALIYFSQIWRQKGDTAIEWVLSLGMALTGGTLFVLLGIFLATWLMRYYLAEYMIFENSEISASEAIKQAIAISRGRRFEFFLLELSLLGWRVADLLVLPRLFTLPYRLTVKGLYAHYLVEVTKRDTEKVQSE